MEKRISLKYSWNCLFQERGGKPLVEVEDVVITRDEQTKHAFWKIGRIIELIKGRDGNLRVAKEEVPTDRGKSILSCSLQHLIPLKLNTPIRYMQPLFHYRIWARIRGKIANYLFTTVLYV